MSVDIPYYFPASTNTSTQNPSSSSSNLPPQVIHKIIKQKEQFYKYQRKRDSQIWHDSEFHPGQLLDKISDHIARSLIDNVVSEVENICDDFIDELIHSEFFPDEHSLTESQFSESLTEESFTMP